MSWLVNVLLLLGLAMVVRALLGTRRVTWPRLALASVGGLLSGVVLAVLVVDPSGSTLRWSGSAVSEVNLIAVPIQIVITMGLVVTFELVSTRSPDRHKMPWGNPVTILRRRAAIAARGAEVSAIAAKHGLAAHPHLGEQKTQGQWARELRLTLEDLGGIYVKLGQILSTRPDLLSPEAARELRRLQSWATPLPFTHIRRVLTDELGDPDAVFASIDTEPLGSASIAQAHAALLHDGTPVVIKVQRPGLSRRMDQDLAILDWLSDQLELRSAAARAYGAHRLASEFSAALHSQLDFTVEGRQMDAARAAVDEVPEICVPLSYPDLTTPRVLVMERLDGTTLADSVREEQDHSKHRAALAEALCRSQASAIMTGSIFHADPHPGNVLLLEDGRIGLIDFGMTGQLDSFGRAFVVELMGAVQLGDPALMYEALLTAGSIDAGADRLTIERALAGYLATYKGGDVLSGEGLAAMFRLAAEQGIPLPTQASTLLNTIATLGGTLNDLDPDYPFVERVSRIAGREFISRLKPENARKTLHREMATLLPFAKRLPPHVERIATQIERGELTSRVSLFHDPSDVAVLHRLLSRILLMVAALGMLVVSVMLLSLGDATALGTTGIRLTDLLGWAGLFGGIVLLLRSLIDAFRHARTDRTPRR